MSITIKPHATSDDHVELWSDGILWAVVHVDMWHGTEPIYTRLRAKEQVSLDLEVKHNLVAAA